MTTDSPILEGFAYGEDIQGPLERGLGFRLLAPAVRQDWFDEVDALARRLQAAPYPDHWPTVDLFCSVLLREGIRVVALARYGLIDHTQTHRPGGLELIGMLGPGSLGVPSALAIYRWLCQRRAAVADLRLLGERYPLADILEAEHPSPSPVILKAPPAETHQGATLYSARAPTDPNQYLGLLENESASTWQWIALIGPDFPLGDFVERGPVIAWRWE